MNHKVIDTIASNSDIVEGFRKNVHFHLNLFYSYFDQDSCHP